MKLIAIERATILLCDSHPCTGDCIPPHTDHASYPRPICTLSMLNAEPMLLGTRFITTGEGELSCAHPTQHTHLRPHLRPPQPARAHARTRAHCQCSPFRSSFLCRHIWWQRALVRPAALFVARARGQLRKHCQALRTGTSESKSRASERMSRPPHLNRPFVNSCAHAGLLYPVPPSPRRCW